MACFQGTLTAYTSPDGNLVNYERLSGELVVVCPIDVVGPHSLCLDDGTELWYDEAEPFDFE